LWVRTPANPEPSKSAGRPHPRRLLGIHRRVFEMLDPPLDATQRHEEGGKDRERGKSCQSGHETPPSGTTRSTVDVRPPQYVDAPSAQAHARCAYVKKTPEMPVMHPDSRSLVGHISVTMRRSAP